MTIWTVEENFLTQIVVCLLAHSRGDDDRQTHLIHALDNIPAPTNSDPGY